MTSLPCEAVVTLVTNELNTDEATKDHVQTITYTKVFRLEFVSEQEFLNWLAMAQKDSRERVHGVDHQVFASTYPDALHIEQLGATATPYESGEFFG